MTGLFLQHQEESSLLPCVHRVFADKNGCHTICIAGTEALEGPRSGQFVLTAVIQTPIAFVCIVKKNRHG